MKKQPLIAIFLAMAASIYVLGQEQQKLTPAQKGVLETPSLYGTNRVDRAAAPVAEPAAKSQTSVEGPERRLRRASEFIGAHVFNPQGEKLGEIRDLAVDLEQGTILYAGLVTGGLLNIGKNLVAVPITLLVPGDKPKRWTMNAERSQLAKSTGFKDEAWPDRPANVWGAEKNQPHATKAASRIRKASDLIGLKVENDSGEKLGEIKDLVVDLGAGRIAYAVLSVGGLAGIGDKLVAVPIHALEQRGGEKVLFFNADKDRLKSAPTYDAENPPATPSWGGNEERKDEVSPETKREPREKPEDQAGFPSAWGAATGDQTVAIRRALTIATDPETAQRIRILSQDGKFILEGQARSPAELQKLEEAVRGLPGMDAVENRITSGP